MLIRLWSKTTDSCLNNFFMPFLCQEFLQLSSKLSVNDSRQWSVALHYVRKCTPCLLKMSNIFDFWFIVKTSLYFSKCILNFLIIYWFHRVRVKTIYNCTSSIGYCSFTHSQLSINASKINGYFLSNHRHVCFSLNYLENFHRKNPNYF